MRKFNNYEAVKINSIEEAMEFLQYLGDNTDLKWYAGYKPTEINKEYLKLQTPPFFFEVFMDKLIISSIENLEAKTKIIPLSEFLEPKVTYTREQAEKVFRDYNHFHVSQWSLGQHAIAFIDHKFPKSTLEQVTEAVKDLGDFTIEQTSTGEIIISPIKTTEQ